MTANPWGAKGKPRPKSEASQPDGWWYDYAQRPTVGCSDCFREFSLPVGSLHQARTGHSVNVPAVPEPVALEPAA